jgi:non-ribosomal peptide synthase protein (TIGR01720 family)
MHQRAAKRKGIVGERPIMMISELLTRLSSLNVKLWVEGDRLGYSAPKGVVTPGLQAELHEYKAKLITLLSEANSAELSIRADQCVITGRVPLTPVQRKFFAQNPPAPQHWNIATMIELPPVSAALLRQALRHVIQHHDALRLRFVQANAAWQQRIANLDDTLPFSQIDLAALPITAQQAVCAAIARTQQASLNLADGPLLRVALIECGQQPTQLLVIANHLACDGFSIEIVLQDLAQAYQQLAAGKPVQLPLKTTSFKEWAEQLEAYAQSAALRRELSYWLATLREPIAQLPVDRPGGMLTEANARLVQVALTHEETGRLHERLHAQETTITDMLLTALTLAFARWAGGPAWLIEVVSHGRETIFDDIDLSRTVGWLVNHAPVRLCIDPAHSASDNLQQVKAQVRRLPNRGFGFEVLRYLTKDAALADTLAALPQSQVIFNFLGRAAGSGNDAALFAPQPQLGPTGVHKNVPGFLLIFNGRLFDDRLYLGLTYSDASYDQRTIMALGQHVLAALRELL